MSAQIIGLERLVIRLAKVAGQGMPALTSALEAEARAILSDSVAITPKKTGKLQRSGRVENAISNATAAQIDIIFGNDDDVTYAAEVHENILAFHEPPAQSKFLETPAREHEVGLEQRVSHDMWRTLGPK